MLAIESQVAVPDAAAAQVHESGPASMIIDNLDNVRLGSAELVAPGKLGMDEAA